MHRERKAGRERCRLKHSVSIEAWCSREKCIFWRLVEAQDADISNRKGCGLQYFDFLDGMEPELARWLAEVKDRLEAAAPEEGKSRITFRYRES
jgi:hypothetical protein